MYSSAQEGRLAKTTFARTAAAPAGLPQTGGGFGGNPVSPLAPLTVLAALAIGAGRFLPRLLKR